MEPPGDGLFQHPDPLHSAEPIAHTSAHLKMVRSSTQTTESCVAATVALRGLLYMRLISPKVSPRCFMLTLMLTPCRRSSTSNSPSFTTYSSLAARPADPGWEDLQNYNSGPWGRRASSLTRHSLASLPAPNSKELPGYSRWQRGWSATCWQPGDTAPSQGRPCIQESSMAGKQQ